MLKTKTLTWKILTFGESINFIWKLMKSIDFTDLIFENKNKMKAYIFIVQKKT